MKKLIVYVFGERASVCVHKHVVSNSTLFIDGLSNIEEEKNVWLKNAVGSRHMKGRVEREKSGTFVVTICTSLGPSLQ